MKTAFEPIVDINSKILILGTMPSEKSLQFHQYYGNKINHFWKIIFTLLNEPYTDSYKEKVNLLLKHNIAIWDVLKSCEGKGSLDSNIKNEQANDFVAFFNLYPNIKYVFFSSKQAQLFYKKHINQTFDKIYDILPSPSTANAKYNLKQKIQLWQKILNFI